MATLSTLRAALASAERDRTRLERTLALKEEAIVLLRDCLADAESEGDALRRIIAGQREAADRAHSL